MSIFVRSVRAASSCSTETLKPSATVVEMATGRAPHSLIPSGYVTQYGAGTSTSSPGSSSAWNAA